MLNIEDIAKDQILIYPISRGMHTLIDAEDLAKVRQGKWYAIHGWLYYKQYYLGLFDSPEEASIVVEEFYAKS